MKRQFKPLTWELAGVYVILALALLGQFARLELPVGRVSLHELVLAPFSLFMIWKYRSNLLPTIRKSIVLLMTVFLFWTAATTFFSAQSLQIPALWTEGSAYLTRLMLYLVFGLGMWLWSRAKNFPAERLRTAVVSWLLLQAAIGLGQYLLFPDTRLLFFLGWDDHLSRAFGTLLDPGFFGLFMAWGALMSFVSATHSTGKRRLFWISALSLCIGALALSYSRASYVAFLAGVGVLSWRWKQRSVLLLIPLLVLCLVLLPKDGGGEGQNLLRTRSIEAREEVLVYHSEGLGVNEILFGRGWYYESALALHEQALLEQDPGKQAAVSPRQNAQAVDNVFLHIFFSTGVVGFALYATWQLLLLWKLRTSPELLAILVAVLAHSLFSTALLYSWSMLLLGVLSVSFQAKK